MSGSNLQTNTAAESDFFDAICRGQMDEVRRRVSADRSLLDAYNYNAYGATPLTQIVFQDDRAMIDTLIDFGADLNRRSDWWAGPWSPLHCAIYGAKDELAEYLLGRGAVLDVHTAASLGRMDDLVRLLDESPDRIREMGGDGCQPLHFAGTEAAAQLLLDRGADIEARCVDHFSTPVQYLSLPRPEIACFLFGRGAVPDIFSAVMAAAGPVVETLLAAEANVVHERLNQQRFPPGNEHDVHNVMTFMIGSDATPLHAAAQTNRPAIIGRLVEAGLDVNVRGGYDYASSLHIAAWEDHLEAAIQLIASGADVNVRSGEIHNNSPAGWAIVAGSYRVFDLLMDQGAEILDCFMEDALAAVQGKFRPNKVAPRENRDRVLQRLQAELQS